MGIKIKSKQVIITQLKNVTSRNTYFFKSKGCKQIRRKGRAFSR